MGFLEKILIFIRHILGIGVKQPIVPSKVAPDTERPLQGTNGPLDADLLVMREDDRVIVVVDHDFTDMPEWVEWDVSRNIFAIAQMGGAVAEMKNVIPPDKAMLFHDSRNVFLATRFEGRHVVHSIYMVVRAA